jgi:hypothetical protein
MIATDLRDALNEAINAGYGEREITLEGKAIDIPVWTHGAIDHMRIDESSPHNLVISTCPEPREDVI